MIYSFYDPGSEVLRDPLRQTLAFPMKWWARKKKKKGSAVINLGLCCPPVLLRPFTGALQCNFLIAVYEGAGMQRVSMPSDLAPTSPLLLQLLNPPGVHITKQTPNPRPGTPGSYLSPRSRSLDRPCSHAPVPGSSNNPPPTWLQQTVVWKASPASWVSSQFERWQHAGLSTRHKWGPP